MPAELYPEHGRMVSIVLGLRYPYVFYLLVIDDQ